MLATEGIIILFYYFFIFLGFDIGIPTDIVVRLTLG